jgi:signal transduction histidine kinase/ligand-binding sensor domain-containing protein/CheY-like chemotaxis protein
MKYIRFIIIIFVILALQACLWHGKQAHEVDNHKEEVSQETSIDTLSLPIDVRVKFVTLQDGLPSNAVSDIYQDQKGFMWFSTNNGLARYDGNQMKVYLQDSAYASSSDRRVKRITEDKDFKYMWIYTASETFYCLDMTTGHLVDYLSEAKGWRAQERPLHFTQSKLQENGLFYMWEPKDGGLIVDYRDGNFKVKHLSAKEMEAILPKLQDVKMADKQLVQKWKVPNGRVLTDNKGGKWIYNNTGILRKVVGDSLITLRLLPNETNYIDYERFNIVEDNHGLVWISTYGKGLFVFNHDLNQGQHFVANEKGESPIASNYLLCITADRRDGVWVSAEYGGVSHLQVMDKGVVRIFPNGRENLDLSNVVRMVKKQRDGSVMVGTRDGCLYHYSADMAQMLVKSHFDSNIYSVVEMPQGRMWIGTRGKGIYGIPGLDFKNKKVFCLKPDDRGRMWIGTFGEGLSVAIPRGEGYEVRTFFADSVGLNEVRCLAIDRKGMLWGGTSGGLFCVDPTRFAADGKGLRVYKRGSEIHDMLVDRQGRLWLTVPGEGLVCMQDGNFRILDASQGLINNMVQSVVETEDGNLWVSTQQGVSCWKAKDNSFDNYLFSRVMMGNVYNENSAVCLDDGRVLLGGNYGLTIINPSRISHVKGQTSVVFTSHPYSDEMTLSYEERSPKINFSTLDYSDVNNVKYTYWLEGYDSSWSVPSPTPWVNYQNLPFGSYRLHVKASYSDGIWGKESVLDISVEPPFYLSVWAWVFYALFLTVVIVMVVKSIREKNILKGKIKFEQEFTRYKLVFFTNIAHEFRTPLTLIQGSLEKEKRIMKTNHWQLELEKTVRTMDKSVQRMLRLIDQLLEFRKMQAGKLKLSLQETDVVMFVQGICKMFDDAAESKQIDFKFESQLPAYLMYLDQQKMDKVVFNLLSNAFKYTHAKGTISVSLSFTDVMTIRVADTGVGIPQEKREQLFSRFMQSSYTGESFGIGLHLTHELVRTHHGEITYQENEGGGSVFVVTIPLQKDCYEASDFLVKDSPILKADLTKERDGQEEKTTDAVPSAPSAPLNRRTILLIEDDNDVREFLLSELESCFDLKVASDGKAGIAMAKELDVDLIVSDVMMPGMNGFELTKRLKNSFETSHIPIILLTALSTDENVLEGTESGADAYITKPFSPQLLMARILQLLNQREILRQKFGKVPQEIRSAMLRNEQDSLFVKRLDSIVYSRLGEQDLSVDKVAGLLHLGRTIFYKKVRGTTGYTPNEYIRVIRLRKAAELLKEGEKNVSEVAYAVGFDNPYYFSKCFKEQFGMPPSQYRS